MVSQGLLKINVIINFIMLNFNNTIIKDFVLLNIRLLKKSNFYIDKYIIYHMI